MCYFDRVGSGNPLNGTSSVRVPVPLCMEASLSLARIYDSVVYFFLLSCTAAHFPARPPPRIQPRSLTIPPAILVFFFNQTPLNIWR